MLRIAAVLALLWPGFALAQQAGPRLPCDAASWDQAAPGAAPAVGVWRDRDLRAASWTPPRCAGWDEAARSRLIVTLAGTFAFNGSLDDLLARVGAISGLTRQRYWSVSDGAWRPLVSDAAALSAPEPGARRGDFAPAELRQGGTLYYSQSDGRASGATVYRLRVRASGADQAVVEMENVTPIRYRFITLFDRGSLQVVMYIRKLRPGLWGAYTATRVGEGASSFAVGREASYVNRTAALYRLVAGIPSDAEPPPAR